MQLLQPTEAPPPTTPACETIDIVVSLHCSDYALLQQAGRITREDVARFLVTSGYLRAKHLIGNTHHEASEFQKVF